MSRPPLIAGNWKMNTTVSEAAQLALAIVHGCENLPDDRQVMLAPPFTALAAVADVVQGSRVILAGQNVCWAAKGAFTGEISATMLQELGCQMVIIGHSERRHVFGEGHTLLNQRVLGAVKQGLTPIFCVGETLEERETDRTMQVLEEQLKEGLADLTLANTDELVIAYEPVWAIGTGKTATVEQAQEVHGFIRQQLAAIFEKNIASHMRILYGGSVNPGNVDALMGQNDVDGALVGGAALAAESFDRIIHFRS